MVMDTKNDVDLLQSRPSIKFLTRRANDSGGELLIKKIRFLPSGIKRYLLGVLSSRGTINVSKRVG